MIMDEKFHSARELYGYLLPALRTKKNEMHRRKYKDVTENDLWSYFCQYVWNKKVDLTIGEMVDDILNTEALEILLKKGKENETN